MQDIANAFGVKRKDAKRLVLRLCFGGTVEGWKKDENIEVKEDLQFLKDFIKQLRDIAEVFKEHY